MKKNILILIFVAVITIVILAITFVVCKEEGSATIYSDKDCKYIVYFNRYNKNGSNRKDFVFYYDEDLKLVSKEEFNAKAKVPNQIMIKDKIYSYGYGGIYETDIIKQKTEALNTSTAINIVKYDKDGNIYTYLNSGYESGSSGKYNSKILKNNKDYIKLDYPVLDFCVLNNILYVTIYNDIKLNQGKICIYDNNEKISEYDVDLSNGEGKWAIYKNNVFFLKTNSAFKVEQNELFEVKFENNNADVSKPRVISNIDFSKLYIDSVEVEYRENKLFFKKDLMRKSLDYNFNKSEQTLTINNKTIKINDNDKYNYIFLHAFEI